MSENKPINVGRIYWESDNNVLYLSSMPTKPREQNSNEWITYTNTNSDEVGKKIVEQLLGQPNSNPNTTMPNATNVKPVKGIFWEKVGNDTYVAMNPTGPAPNNWIKLYPDKFEVIAKQLLEQYNKNPSEVQGSSSAENNIQTKLSSTVQEETSETTETSKPAETRSIGNDTSKLELAEFIKKLLDGLANPIPSVEKTTIDQTVRTKPTLTQIVIPPNTAKTVTQPPTSSQNNTNRGKNNSRDRFTSATSALSSIGKIANASLGL